MEIDLNQSGLCIRSTSVPLTQGQTTIVDDEDYPLVSGHKWYAAKSGGGHIWYAIRKTSRREGRRRTTQLHREILNLKQEQICDHINHDGLDNRRCNLRVVTSKQNSQNRRKSPKAKASKYKGVTPIGKRWRAAIDKKHIGFFDSEEEAARAYDAEAVERFGKFAATNFARGHTRPVNCLSTECL